MKGWFLPPASTYYRFYMSCDDYCQLDMALDSADPATITNLLSSNSHIDHRDYFYRVNVDRPDLESEWVYLEEG